MTTDTAAIPVCPGGDTGQLTDEYLLGRVRQGDAYAYGMLFQRHQTAARRLASRYARTRHGIEDLVSEAFARMYATIRRGHGPVSKFRPYLFTTIRTVAVDGYAKTDPEVDVDDFTTLEDLLARDRPVVTGSFGEGVIGDAFLSLPVRWQQVLWCVMVEDLPVAETAELLGLTPNSTSALLYRAREGLRAAYLEHSVAEDGRSTHVERKDLAAYVRGKARAPLRRSINQHLEGCGECARAVDDLTHVNRRLCAIALPLLAGGFGVGAGAVLLQPSQASAATLSSPMRRPSTSRTIRILGSSATTVAVAAGVAAVAVFAVSALHTPARRDADQSVPTSVGVAPPALPSPAPVSARAPMAAPPEERQGSSRPVLKSAPPITNLGSTPAISPTPTPTPTPPSADAGAACVTASKAAGPILAGFRLDDPNTSSSTIDYVDGVPAIYRGAGASAPANFAPCAGGGLGTAFTLNGAPAWLADSTQESPSNVFSITIWFKTATGGGRLIGFGDAKDQTSVFYDRHLYLSDTGQVAFGVFPDQVETIVSPSGYSDGKWHQAVASLSADGMRLFVDGALVASNPDVTTASNYAGYWRVGSDNLSGWGASQPQQQNFTGSLRYAAVYTAALTPDAVNKLYQAERGAPTP